MNLSGGYWLWSSPLRYLITLPVMAVILCVRHNPKQLAVIEATQCGEVIFTLLGGMLVLGDNLPIMPHTEL